METMVDNRLNLIVDFLIILLFIVGLSRFRNPKSTRVGNLTAAFAMLCGVGSTVLEPVKFWITPKPTTANTTNAAAIRIRLPGTHVGGAVCGFLANQIATSARSAAT